MIHKNDIIAVASAIVAAISIASSAGFGDQIDAIAPGWGKKVLAVLTLFSTIAMVVARVLSNPSPIAVATVTTSRNATPVSVPVTPAEPTSEAK